MGGGGNRCRTRPPLMLLPCLLASARWIVTILLSALTLAVLVMAIAVCLRPQNIDLSVLHGHVEAKILLLLPLPSGTTTTTTLPHATFAALRPQPRKMASSSSLDLRFSLSATNPSGRASITVQNITIDIIRFGELTPSYLYYSQSQDIPTDLVNISRVRLAVDHPFILMPESTHTIRKLARVSDAEALGYVSATYPRAKAFRVMLRVSLNVSSSPAIILLKATRYRVVTHYCWPVTIGLGPPMASSAADDKAQGCTREEDLPFALPTTLPPTPTTTSPSPSPSPSPSE